MEVINLNGINDGFGEEVSIALGNFDGVHVAHQSLINKMIEESKELGIKSSILLFVNHTREVTTNTKTELLTTEKDKLKILEDLGVDIVYKIRFNKDIMSLSPEDFVKNVLVNELNVKSVTVGFDYRFGHKASGSSEDLKSICKDYNIRVNIVDPVYKDELVSSTKIREYIRDGRIEEANEMLGREYSIRGKVIPGNQVGRKLGFPTANIEVDSNYLVPKYGIYAAMVEIDGKDYISATNVGITPTFSGNKLKLENHIIDFKGDIYGKELNTRFIKYIREEIKFDNLDDLINQIDEDVKYIKACL